MATDVMQQSHPLPETIETRVMEGEVIRPGQEVYLSFEGDDQLDVATVYLGTQNYPTVGPNRVKLVLKFDSETLQELAQARATAARPVRTPPVAVAESPGLASERDRLRLEGQLQAEIRKTEDLKNRLADLTHPQVNTAIFSLGLVRGEGDRTNRVIVGPRPEWIVLSIETPEAGPETWRATLLDRGGRIVWRGEGLRPTASDELVLGLYSDLLAPGDYRLRLEAVPAQGHAAGEIPFRVERRAAGRG